MNWLDLIIVSVIAFFTLVGISRGLVSQVFSALAVAGGLAAGFIFYDAGGRALAGHRIIENEPVAFVAAFFILAIGCYIVILIAGWLVGKLIGTLRLGLFNRIAGGALGAVIGLVTAFVFTTSLSLFYSEKDPAFRDSKIVPYMNDGFAALKSSVPGDFQKSFERARELIREEGLKAAMRISDSDALRIILDNDGDKPSRE